MTSDTGFEVTMDLRGDTATLGLRGELDMATAWVLGVAVAKAVRSPVTSIVFDLTHLSFLGSSGLNVILAAHRQAADVGRRCTLVHPNRTASKILHITGTDRLLDVEHESRTPVHVRVG